MGLYNQSLTGMTTSGGFHVPPAQGLIQFSTSNYNVASGAQDSITKMIATKTDLAQPRDTAIAQMKAASDQSEVQKDQAIISSLNGALLASTPPFSKRSKPLTCKCRKTMRLSEGSCSFVSASETDSFPPVGRPSIRASTSDTFSGQMGVRGGRQSHHQSRELGALPRGFHAALASHNPDRFCSAGISR